ncbi:glycoside hydrolase domain-containing protein [Streptomyces sp. NPDC024062]|uniref:glycoside hydrolase domain-containing protein n=1 Tax=unclassified Streptomyces TaxID=2593676 RepID=UPI0034444FC1
MTGVRHRVLGASDVSATTVRRSRRPGGRAPHRRIEHDVQQRAEGLPIYQDNARQLSDFTYSQGYQHALSAHSLASGYGFNRGTVIYFAVDYDATRDEIDAAIVPYFHGVAAGLAYNGRRYVHGVYGSRNVCTVVSRQTGARYSFVSGMSWGFSGNLGFPIPANWSFNQIKEFKVTQRVGHLRPRP